MVVTVRSLGLQGIAGYEVEVECAISGGLPAFDVVGLPDAAVKEARERVRAAIKSCGCGFPVSRITVNLAPAALRKAGTVYDLPILLGLLAAQGDVPAPSPAAAFLGELSLTGALRPVAGVLPMAMAAARSGIKELYVPAETPPRPHWPRASPSTRWKMPPPFWPICGRKSLSPLRRCGRGRWRRSPARIFPRWWARRT